MLAALATLVAGFFLERSGDAIAKHIGLSGVLFGATVLAAATALPEVAAGNTSVRMKAYQLAVSEDEHGRRVQTLSDQSDRHRH